ncbi:hypothetical protein LTR56_022422 [Elasticomyces elasticus]|nr:hypothetical protein LTR56_022422 [Elasticomyces elasticus]KAK3633015.1 hypothetical protein LTR22_020333 [Elasticomyces elasticus]KAK4932724.1 hypothetical protein LTR49_001148 [Elasticomyces elasticus]KAK5769747.1 hypothetical protein LTS12_000197 [Elasticomyces elasticus]
MTMKTFFVLAGLLASTLTTAQRVVLADIWKPDLELTNGTILGFNATLSKRQFNSVLTQKSDRSLYWINVTIGTPGQKQSMQLDTGSSSVLVPATGSGLCRQSTTVGFVDGGSVTGNWFYDTVRVGGKAIKSQLSVLGTSGSGLSEGVLGIGFPASYPTINHNLAARGVIASNSYSIWLDSLSSSSGTILFGGLNTARFVAPLKKIPVLGSTNADGSVSYNLPSVALTRVATLQGSTRTVQTPSGYSEPAMLDTGTPVTILQQSLADAVIAALGASYYPSGSTSGNAVIPCAAASNSQSINFHFSGTSGPTINVPISQLVLANLGTVSGVAWCQFGIYGAADSQNLATVLGDSFLRSAYAVYDLDHHQIGLAQTLHNGGAANIMEIGANGIPIGDDA